MSAYANRATGRPADRPTGQLIDELVDGRPLLALPRPLEAQGSVAGRLLGPDLISAGQQRQLVTAHCAEQVDGRPPAHRSH